MARSKTEETPTAPNTTEGVFRISGKGYPDRWADTKVPYAQGTTVADIIALGHAENEAAIVKAFYGQFNIRASGDIKEAAALPETTVATLSEILRTFKIHAERQTGTRNVSPEAKAAAAETRARKAADASAMEAMRAKAVADPRLAELLAEAQRLMNG